MLYIILYIILYCIIIITVIPIIMKMWELLFSIILYSMILYRNNYSYSYNYENVGAARVTYCYWLTLMLRFIGWLCTIELCAIVKILTWIVTQKMYMQGTTAYAKHMQGTTAYAKHMQGTTAYAKHMQGTTAYAKHMQGISTV